MSFVYKQSEPELWTVGHYAPDGLWIPESDHDSPEKAVEQIEKLNAGKEIYPIPEGYNGIGFLIARIPLDGPIKRIILEIDLYPQGTEGEEL